MSEIGSIIFLISLLDVHFEITDRWFGVLSKEWLKFWALESSLERDGSKTTGKLREWGMQGLKVIESQG